MPGGSSGGQQTTTQTQTAEPWSGQEPYLRDAFNQAQQRYQSGGPQYYPDATVTPFAPQTEYALQAGENRAMMGNPLNFAAQNSVNDTLTGQYMNGAIPALSDRIAGDVRSRVDSIYNAGNRGPSAGYAESLGRGITEGLAPVQFGAYENERGRQMQAAAMAPQLAMSDYNDINALNQIGMQRQGQAQNVLNADIGRYNYEQTLPDQTLNEYLARISGNYGGTTTGAINTPLYQNGLAMGLGGAASGASTGFMIGGPWGAGIGAGLGLLSGL